DEVGLLGEPAAAGRRAAVVGEARDAVDRAAAAAVAARRVQVTAGRGPACAAQRALRCGSRSHRQTAATAARGQTLERRVAARVAVGEVHARTARTDGVGL